MTSPAHDYLLKQLSINNNIVTFRSLSRELGVHVNVAKNELATYHALSATSSSATYLITGEVQPTTTRRGYGDGMDIDGEEYGNEEEYEEDDEDEDGIISEMKIVLVSEDQLESSKSQFTRIFSTHIYALSPAPIRDAGLICTPTPSLRQIDTNKYLDTTKGKGKATDTEVGKAAAERGVEWGKTVGKVIGAHVVMKTGKQHQQPIASTSKAKPVAAAADTKAPPKDGKQENEKPKPKAAEKPKATGKLDWSNAKTKDMKAAEAKEVKKMEKEKEVAKKGEAKKAKEKAAKVKEETKEEKRGTKRKSTGALLSDSDSEKSDEDEAPPKSKSKYSKAPSKAPPKPPPAKEKSSARVKKGVIFSSDEDDDEEIERAPKKRLQKGRKMVDRESDEDEEGDGGEAERSLRAMMDIDDDQVTRVTRDPPSTAHPTESEASPASLPHDEDEDVDMAAADEEPKVKPQPRKKKPKKVIPVGRNGLKKRRVEKSRTSFDEKGYMVTEDYSSYESVTDVDEADDLPAKAKGKTKEGPKLVEKKTTKEDPPVESVSKPKALGKAPSTGKAAASSTTKSKMGGSSKGDIKNFFAKK